MAKISIRKQFIISRPEAYALEMLINAGYAFPADTEVGVLRRMLRETWERQFPMTPFPKEENTDEES